MATSLNIAERLRAPKAGPDLPHRARAARATRVAARRRSARDPRRRLRLPAEPRLELSRGTGRHLRVPVADQALRPAHRRHDRRPGAAAEAGGALSRAAQGRDGERRRARHGEGAPELRDDAPALSGPPAAAGIAERRPLDARGGPHRADRQGAARTDRRAAARREDDPPPEDGERHRRRTIRR